MISESILKKFETAFEGFVFAMVEKPCIAGTDSRILRHADAKYSPWQALTRAFCAMIRKASPEFLALRRGADEGPH